MVLSHQENSLVNQVKFLRLVLAFATSKQFASHLLKKCLVSCLSGVANFIGVINNLIGSYNILGIDPRNWSTESF